MGTISERIQFREDGYYHWTCRVDPEYERRGTRYVMTVCSIIGVFLLGFGLFLSISYNDWKAFAIVVGSVAVYVLIYLGVCLLFDRLNKDPSESYIMNEQFVQTGSGRARDYFMFKKTRVALVTPSYIELRGKVWAKRVYVPYEDRGFVKGFILARMPAEAEIRYL